MTRCITGCVAILLALAATRTVIGVPAGTVDEPPPPVQGPVAPPQSPVEALSDRVPALPERMAALNPSDPGAYFALGEEVASESEQPNGRRLARQLFALSFALAGAGEPAPRNRALRAGSLKALASLSESESERRWLLALAKLEEATRSSATGEPVATPQPTGLETGALEAATALDMARNGEGRRAVKLMTKPGVMDLLNRYDKLLEPNGYGGGVDRVQKMAADWPMCPECKNRRVVKDKEGVHLCPTCGGRPGPHLQEPELVALVRTEAVLLSGPQLSWASQTLVDDGAPLRDLSPSEVAPTYGVDPVRPLWRIDRWEAGEISPKPPDAPKP